MFLIMNLSQAKEQIFSADSLTVDEFASSEVKNLCDLMNAIFAEAVSSEVQKLCAVKCSRRRHKCIMLSEKEGWMMHGLETIDRVIGQEILWR